MAEPAGLDRVRVAAAWAFLGLLVVLALSTLTGLTPNVDLGVFGTLMGGFLAVIGAGVVVKLLGPGKS